MYQIKSVEPGPITPVIWLGNVLDDPRIGATSPYMDIYLPWPAGAPSRTSYATDRGDCLQSMKLTALLMAAVNNAWSKASAAHTPSFCHAEMQRGIYIYIYIYIYSCYIWN